MGALVKNTIFQDGEGLDTTLFNLVRVKRYPNKKPIKVYWGKEDKNGFFIITIIILIKQKHYYQYISAKQNKKNYQYILAKQKKLSWNKYVHLITPVNRTLRFLAPENNVLPADSP